MSDESSLDKLLRLATADVHQYRRFERGREQVVKQHTEIRAPGKGYIPEPKWKEGEQIYTKRGEAAWAKHQQAWESEHGHSATSAPPALRRNGRSLQQFAEDMETDRKQRAGRLGTSPAFGQAPTTHEGVITSAADQAVDNTAVQSGQLTADEVAQMRRQMADMQQRLQDMEETSKQNAAAAAQESESRTHNLLHEKGRAALALELLAVVAGLIVAYFSGGGAAGLIAEVMAAKWTVDAAKAVMEFHMVDKGVGREALAHPVAVGKKKAVAAETAVASKAKSSASKAKAAASQAASAAQAGRAKAVARASARAAASRAAKASRLPARLSR